MFLKSAPATRRRKLKLAFASLFLLPFANASNASQQTAPSTFTVQMTVATTCIINSTSTLDFGSPGMLNANVDSSSNLAVQCTNSTPYNIALDAGQNGGRNVNARKMINGSNTISYLLYSDSARSAVWGNTFGSNTVAATGNRASQNYTVYGRVPPQTTPAPGAYSDTITVVVTY